MAAALKVVETGMDKQKALDAALAQIDRAFGKGSAMKLGQQEKVEVEGGVGAVAGLLLQQRRRLLSPRQCQRQSEPKRSHSGKRKVSRAGCRMLNRWISGGNGRCV